MKLFHRHHSWERTWLSDNRLRYESQGDDGSIIEHDRPTGPYSDVCTGCGKVVTGHDLNLLIPGSSAVSIDLLMKVEESNEH